MNIFVTSDQHYGHKNIMEYCHRQFLDIQTHDLALINAWNKVVGPKDLVYHLGDLSLGRPSFVSDIIMQLKGSIRLLYYPYHHDGNWLLKMLFIEKLDIVEPIVVIENPIIVMCHYPFEVWDRKHYGALHFHGHSHGMLPKIPNRLDVGVDNAYKLFGEYRPFKLEEAIQLAKGE